MKTYRFVTALLLPTALIFAACDGGKLKDAEARNAELKNDLTETLATQDSLFALLNDITDGMSQIKDLEQIVSAPANLSAESPGRKDQIKQDIMMIKATLQERRERLAELEKKLKSSGAENATLTKTIESLKKQLAEQDSQITELTEKLSQANIKIEELGSTVRGLTTTVDSLSGNLDTEKLARENAEKQALQAETELNECFYAIGSKKELKEHKILETGFLRKAKVLKGDFEQSYFSTGDKRTLTLIPLHSKKAEVLTSQPKDSYVIESYANGQKTLRITDPAKFWQMTNYLVIQVD